MTSAPHTSETADPSPRAQTDDGITMAPGISMTKVFDVDMTSYCGEYEDPERVPEWKWVSSKACFEHRGNGSVEGVWEFVVHVDVDCSEMPNTLDQVFTDAKSCGCGYIIFHQ